jgi:hypothetical protein
MNSSLLSVLRPREQERQNVTNRNNRNVSNPAGMHRVYAAVQVSLCFDCDATEAYD